MERRKAVRAKRIISIQYRLVRSRKKGVDKTWHLSTTQDMSVLGISFLSEVGYHIDDVLELNVVMSGVLDIYQGFGKVVRVEKERSGGYFLIAVKLVAASPVGRKTEKSNSSPRKTSAGTVSVK